VKPVLVRPAAAADIEEAFHWYEGQRMGLGLEFRSELEATIDRLAASPEQLRAPATGRIDCPHVPLRFPRPG
jgi:plasmid stabilization system protein ParE